ncbi:MAG TPA: porin, partial [Ferruginibacter sp.]|nr:porin [Ferruginibacter sp.]
KPVKLSPKISLSAGTSFLYGGLESNTKYLYRTETVQGMKIEVLDSTQSNLGYVAPRHYAGVDAQLKIKNRKGYTEFRVEWISGKQTGTLNSSETPNALLTGADGFHIRRFNGAYIYFLQHLFSPYHQLILKYDWYDPNSAVSGNEIGAAGSNLGAANVKFSTLGIGYGYTISENVRLTIYYDRVRNEQTQLPGFTTDRSDDVLTTRMQFRF